MRRADLVRGVLVVDCVGIGDCILNLPLYAALRRHYPKARITLLGQRWAPALLGATGLVDEFLRGRVPWGRGGGRYLSPGFLATLNMVLAQRGRNQIGIEFSGDLRNKLLLRLSDAGTRVGLSYAGVTSGPMAQLVPVRRFPGDRFLTHPVRVRDNWAPIEKQRAACLRVLGVDQPAPRVTLTVAPEERRAAAAALKTVPDTVLLHPGAGVPAKLWPPVHHARVIHGLRRRGRRPVLIAGPGEERLCAEIVLRCADLPVLRPTLRQLAAVVQEAAALICLDSAAAHLAANLGTPAVILYGPQSRRVWRPSGGATVALRREVCADFPCPGRSCPHGAPAPCMAAITPDQVLAAFDSLAGAAAKQPPDPSDGAHLVSPGLPGEVGA